MDKETLSHYGWIVVLILVLSVLLAMATPFGNFIKVAVKGTVQGLFDVSQKAGTIAGLDLPDQNFENDDGGSSTSQVATSSAIFNKYLSNSTCHEKAYQHTDDCWTSCEPVTLTWEELKLADNGTKYGYSASAISDTAVGQQAFIYCASLVSIALPDSVTTIDSNAFNTCTSIESIIFGENSHLTIIEQYAFAYCSSLRCAALPDSVKAIGDYAFNQCTSLTSITLSEELSIIGTNAFMDCSLLASIEIPHSVTTLGDWAFAQCTSLTSVTLSEELTSIGQYTFSMCSSLGSITLPDNITTINSYAFNGCNALTSIDLSNCTKLTKIKNGAFNYCTSLESITLPASITTIGNDAFQGCTSLTSINYAGTMDDWSNITLDSYWNRNVPAAKVICSDGEVTL